MTGSKDLFSRPPPPPEASVNEDPLQVGQEFLFHLYRGSALLEDNQVDEAKGELERALSLQPRDAEGQSLLGVVYFRLGHYPRAIQIFEDLVQTKPQEIAPKVNLGLCYLKTGQVREARELLETVVTQKPDHTRAWGYLGLAFQRLGDFHKAAVAFERAGHPKLAERLRAAHQADHAAPLEPSLGATGLTELSPKDATEPWMGSVPPEPEREDEAPRSVRGITMAPGTDVAVPIHVGRFMRASELVFPEHPRVAVHRSGSALVRIETSFAFRPDCVVAFVSSGPLARRPAFRRSGADELRETLGGSVHPLAWVDGAATLVLAPPLGRRCLALSVSRDEPLVVREEYLLGFEPTVEYVSGRLAIHGGDRVPLVKMTGDGAVVLAAPEHVGALGPDGAGRVQVRADRVVGWTGRMVPAPAEISGTDAAGIRGLLQFSGEGSVLIDTG